MRVLLRLCTHLSHDRTEEFLQAEVLAQGAGEFEELESQRIPLRLTILGDETGLHPGLDEPEDRGSIEGEMGGNLVQGYGFPDLCKDGKSLFEQLNRGLYHGA